MSNYLNKVPNYVLKEEVEEIKSHGVSSEYAFSVILAAGFGLDIADNQTDRVFFNQYFSEMIHELDSKTYYENPYYKNIRIPALKVGKSELKYEKYQAYEGFVCDDIIQTNSGRMIPQIGFFTSEFRFPAFLEDNRIWMTITPNEIETMKEPLSGILEVF